MMRMRRSLRTLSGRIWAATQLSIGKDESVGDGTLPQGAGMLEVGPVERLHLVVRSRVMSDLQVRPLQWKELVYPGVQVELETFRSFC